MINFKLYIIIGLTVLGLLFGTKFYVNNLQNQIANLKQEVSVNTLIMEKTKEQVLNQQKQTEVLINEIRELNKHYAEKETKLYETLEQNKDWS